MMKKTLPDWLRHFEQLHPVGIDMGLTRVSQVWQHICREDHLSQLARQKVITVAGTNGKGSTCKMLSMLLSSQGYRVGMYTSPHIHRFNERIQINANKVDDNQLVRAFSLIDKRRGEISLSYFEATTLVSLLIFTWEQVDFAILEVGLGGRLDAVNIIDADAVIITSIGLDHEVYLGHDLSHIALEKAGVCRTNAPTVYAETGIYDSVLDFAETNYIPLLANGRDYTISKQQIHYGEKLLRLPEHITNLGTRQVANCAGALVLLTTLGLLPDNYADILEHFSLAGRLQRIANTPCIMIDVAHNADSAHALADYLRHQRHDYNRCYAVIGMLNDKDHTAVLTAFIGLFDAVFAGRTEGLRGFSDTDLTNVATQVLNCPVSACGDLLSALDCAKQTSSPDDIIIAFGSFLVAEALLPREEIFFN